MLEHFLPATTKRVLVCLEPINMRWGVDRLRRFCVEDLQVEPDTATSFVFVNKTRETLLLYFVDDVGDQTIRKKLDKGAFLLPAPTADGTPFVQMTPAMLPRLFRS